MSNTTPPQPTTFAHAAAYGLLALVLSIAVPVGLGLIVGIILILTQY